jgi:outer membrane protein OmpA-like peptidoglycan-associated protein
MGKSSQCSQGALALATAGLIALTQASTHTSTRAFEHESLRVPQAGQFGNCAAPVKTEWLEDGRKMRLLEDFQYLDNASKAWLAPKGWVVDGASIPQVLWAFGGPLEGLYRKASVVHDVACDKEQETWQAVHRMFFEAMQCSGVAMTRAQVMYAAVYHCGPRWGASQGVRLFPCSADSLRSFVRRMKILVRLPIFPATARAVESLQPENIASITDPIETLKASLQGRAEVVETEQGVVITLAGFEFDRDQLPAGARPAVAEIASALRDVPGVRFNLEGHTDERGTAEYNLALAERRATRVRDRLVESGIGPDRVTTNSTGEERPDHRENTEANRARNRRVQIRIVEEL